MRRHWGGVIASYSRILASHSTPLNGLRKGRNRIKTGSPKLCFILDCNLKDLRKFLRVGEPFVKLLNGKNDGCEKVGID
jgi:hypothetical protein